MAHPIHDLTNHRFGELTVTSRAGTIRYSSGRTRSTWNTACDAGHTEVRSSQSLGESKDGARCLRCSKLRHDKWANNLTRVA